MASTSNLERLKALWMVWRESPFTTRSTMWKCSLLLNGMASENNI